MSCNVNGDGIGMVKGMISSLLMVILFGEIMMFWFDLFFDIEFGEYIVEDFESYVMFGIFFDCFNVVVQVVGIEEL